MKITPAKHHPNFTAASLLAYLALAGAGAASDTPSPAVHFLSEPLITHIYTADPSAHVFEKRLYLYPSHDIDAGITDRTDGNHYAMRDYHVFSMEKIGSPVTDHGVALDIKDVPWAHRQLWAPDAAQANGRYYLFFPAKDKTDIFRIGVATSDTPVGPFRAEPEPIPGTYSIDPAVFRDSEGTHYLYFGGIAGGQLDRWADNHYEATAKPVTATQAATAPRIAKLSTDLLSLAESVREIQIIDTAGKPLLASDEEHRFFEGCWVHKYHDTYYLSYSTGTTHKLCYATGTSPYGPFTYRGVILSPVKGWTTHHSIVEFDGKWYLFYHDSQLSGQNNLRNVKVTELLYNTDGTIQTINPFIN